MKRFYFIAIAILAVFTMGTYLPGQSSKPGRDDLVIFVAFGPDQTAGLWTIGRAYTLANVRFSLGASLTGNLYHCAYSAPKDATAVTAAMDCESLGSLAASWTDASLESDRMWYVVDVDTAEDAATPSTLTIKGTYEQVRASGAGALDDLVSAEDCDATTADKILITAVSGVHYIAASGNCDSSDKIIIPDLSTFDADAAIILSVVNDSGVDLVVDATANTTGVTTESGSSLVPTGSTFSVVQVASSSVHIIGTGAAADHISIDGTEVVDPDFVSTGDIDFVDTSNTITANINANAVDQTAMADNAIGLAEMAGGTDGNLISYDTNGDPAFVVTGTSTQVLTSNGAGTAPTFQAATGGLANIVDDVTQQISAGDLDMNSNDITGTGNINITGTATFSGAVDTGAHTATTYTADPSDTANMTMTGATTATQVKILHTYVDATDTRMTFVIDDGAGDDQQYFQLDGVSDTVDVSKPLVISNGTSSGLLQIMEPSGSGTNNLTFIVPALAADTDYTWPIDDGDNTEVLQTNGSGVLEWVSNAGGGGDITDVFDCASGDCNAITVESGDTLTVAVGGHLEATDTIIHINNDSGAVLFACTAVYINIFDNPSNLATAEIADADDSAKMPVIGLVEADIANGADGLIVVAGEIETFDTVTGEGWAVGDVLYVNDSGTSADADCGNTLTNVRPANIDDNVQAVARVGRVNGAIGELLIFGAGRANDVPNLEDGKFWVGNGSNVATAVAMSGSATMSSAGVVTLIRTVEVDLDAAAWTVNTTAGATASTYTISGTFENDVMSFADDADDNISTRLNIPLSYDNAVDPTLEINWTSTATSSGACWCLETASVADSSDTSPTATDLDCADTTVDATTTDLNKTLITITAADFVAGEIQLFRLYRDIDAGDAGCSADALGAAALMHTALLTFQVSE